MFVLFLTELRREWQLLQAYWLNTVLYIVVYPIIFTFLVVTFQEIAIGSGATYGIKEQTSAILGVLMWNLCVRTLVEMSSTIKNEADVGTLENIMLLPRYPLKLFSVRVIVTLIMQLLRTLGMAILCVWLVDIQLQFSWMALMVFVLTMMSIGGMGMIFAGLTLVYKQVESIILLISNLALFVGGALVPLNSLGWLFHMIKWLFPMTWGTDILRFLLVPDFTLGNFSLVNNIRGLVFQMLIMLGIGGTVFLWGIQKAKQEATLANY